MSDDLRPKNDYPVFITRVQFTMLKPNQESWLGVVPFSLEYGFVITNNVTSEYFYGVPLHILKMPDIDFVRYFEGNSYAYEVNLQAVSELMSCIRKNGVYFVTSESQETNYYSPEKIWGDNQENMLT